MQTSDVERNETSILRSQDFVNENVLTSAVKVCTKLLNADAISHFLLL